MPKTLPRNLTGYDLLKTLAIFLMIVDHIGYFFYPEDIWFRIFGRFSVPAWFFLIGYAKTREVQKTIWAGGVVLVLSALAAGEYLLPLSILFTLGICRLIIDAVMVRALRNYEAFWGMFFLCFFMALPSLIIVEYGTLGLMFAMFGFIQRNREGLQIGRLHYAGFLLAIALSYIFIQSILLFSISAAQFLMLCAGMAVVMVMLYAFRIREYPGFAIAVPWLLPFLRLTGRRSLEIYVLHLLLFRAIAMVTQPERFEFLAFQIAPQAMIRFFAGL